MKQRLYNLLYDLGIIQGMPPGHVKKLNLADFFKRVEGFRLENSGKDARFDFSDELIGPSGLSVQRLIYIDEPSGIDISVAAEVGIGSNNKCNIWIIRAGVE